MPLQNCRLPVATVATIVTAATVVTVATVATVATTKFVLYLWHEILKNIEKRESPRCFVRIKTGCILCKTEWRQTAEFAMHRKILYPNSTNSSANLTLLLV